MSSEVDGRRARGEARRQQLVDAALVVLGRDGTAGITHRAVAEQAGVALASVSYHFEGIDDLLEKAMERAAQDFVARVAARAADRSVRGLASLLAEELNTNKQLILAEYEVYLYIARHRRPSHASVLAWLDVLCDAYAPDLDADGTRALRATIDGLSMHAVISEAPADPDAIETALRRAWPGTPPA